MDPAKINEMLHRYKIQDHYRINVGGPGVVVVCPRIPMTRYTEFVSIEPEKKGDVGSFRIHPSTPAQEEGLVEPQSLVVESIRPGTLHLNFVAKDSETGEVIPGVEPVGVTVDAR